MPCVTLMRLVKTIRAHTSVCVILATSVLDSSAKMSTNVLKTVIHAVPTLNVKILMEISNVFVMKDF